MDYANDRWNREADAGLRKIRHLLAGSRVPLIVASLCLFLGLGGLAAIVIRSFSPEEKPESFFDPFSDSEEYAFFDAQLVSDKFAYSEFLGFEGNHYHFVVDPNGRVAVAELSDEVFEEDLQEIFFYSYNETESVPTPVRIAGIPKKIPTDLLALCEEAFWEIWGESIEETPDEPAREWFGTWYLDCSTSPVKDRIRILAYVTAALLSVGVILAAVRVPRLLRAQRVMQSVAASHTNDAACSQIAEPGTLFFPITGTFLTRDYLVTTKDNTLQITPLSSVGSWSVRWLEESSTRFGKRGLFGERPEDGTTICTAVTAGTRGRIELKKILDEL